MFSFLQVQFRCVNSITRRYLTNSHYWRSSKKCYMKNNRPNLTYFLRGFHCSTSLNDKLFLETENEHAFGHLPPLDAIPLTWTSSKEVTSINELQDLLARNWRQSNASAIVEAFERVKSVCIAHNISLSDSRFDNLVDGLMDHCEKLTDEEMLKLLRIVFELPQSESSVARNYCDVWNCLDDLCCWKMDSWNLNKRLHFAAAWYTLHLGRISDYTYEFVNKMKDKPRHLSRKYMLYCFFYINISRRHTIPFAIEAALVKMVEQYSVDELAIIAMGYFKTKSKIKMLPILFTMIQKVTDDPNGVNEISLTAILKVIRLTQNFNCIDKTLVMLDKLTPRIDELSAVSCVHLGLVGSGMQIKHEPTLRRCTEKVLKNIDSVRVKDIERILLCNSLFNEETDFYDVAFREIHKEERKVEYIQYNRCLGYILNYLSMRKIYSYELLDKVLNAEYIDEVYGRSARNIPREIFILDCSIDVECPGYKGNRLSPTKRYKAAKWLTDFPPDNPPKKSLPIAAKFYLDLYKTLKNIVSDETLLRWDHVLPHFSRPDIIMCKDKKTGQFVEPQGFANYVLGDVKRVIDADNFNYYAIVSVPLTSMIRNKKEPLGGLLMKERQLKAIGYIPILVLFHEYDGLSPQEQVAFISKKLEESS